MANFLRFYFFFFLFTLNVRGEYDSVVRREHCFFSFCFRPAESLSGTRGPDTHNKSTVHPERGAGTVQAPAQGENPKEGKCVFEAGENTVVHPGVPAYFLSIQIIVHRHFDGLLEHIPMRYIPKDYGGGAPPLIELHGTYTIVYRQLVCPAV